MTIRRLCTEDAAAYQALRLAALLDTPEAFASSHEEEKDLPLDEVARRLVDERDPGVLGAFEAGQLVGVVGLARARFAKMAHKGIVWGMYVAPSARRLGLAGRLPARFAAVPAAAVATAVAIAFMMLRDRGSGGKRACGE